MKYVFFLVSATVVAAAFFGAFLLRPWKPAVFQSQGPTIERLEQLRHLATTRV